jgi:hypothetical protein
MQAAVTRSSNCSALRISRTTGSVCATKARVVVLPSWTMAIPSPSLLAAAIQAIWPSSIEVTPPPTSDPCPASLLQVMHRPQKLPYYCSCCCRMPPATILRASTAKVLSGHGGAWSVCNSWWTVARCEVQAIAQPQAEYRVRTSLHGILSCPFPGSVVVPIDVCLVDVCNLRNQGVIWVGVGQQGADGQEHLQRLSVSSSKPAKGAALPARTLEMVNAGLHWSFKMSRHMLPWLFTLGW